GRPVTFSRQQTNGRPFPPSRQMAMVWSGIPFGRPLRQPQLRAATTSFALLLGQPVAQRVNKVIVRELVVGPTVDRRRSCHTVLARSSMRLSRRDQSRLTVENGDESGKVPGALPVTGSFQKLLVRAHVALDVASRIRQQRLEYRAGRTLMQAMHGIG